MNEELPGEEELCRFTVQGETVGSRLDKALVQLCGNLSRSRIQSLIDEGCVSINGQIVTSSSSKMEKGDEIELTIPLAVAAEPLPENILLDIVYEDADMLIINKPPGMVVHPGAGNFSGTLVNALLSHCGTSLSGIGGVARPGIVHRPDKDTSGLMVVAKNDRAHRGLAAQLESRELTRLYKALVLKTPFPPKGLIEQPIGRHPQNRLKMAVSKNGRAARTHYHVQENFGEAASLVECKLDTGRTHQIRVHMEYLGHPIIGDNLYGPQPTALKAALIKAAYNENAVQYVLAFSRQALHAWAISYIHPVMGKPMNFEQDLPPDFSNLLNYLRK